MKLKNLNMGNFRIAIYFIVIQIVLIAVLLGTKGTITFSALFDTVPYLVIINFVLWWWFDHFGWRQLRRYELIRNFLPPDLHGVWEGKMIPKWLGRADKKPRQPFYIQMTINQRFSAISATFETGETKESLSRAFHKTISSELIADSTNKNVYEFLLVYESEKLATDNKEQELKAESGSDNDEKSSQDKESNQSWDHLGTLVIKYLPVKADNTESLDGEYWANKRRDNNYENRGTAGDVWLKRS